MSLLGALGLNLCAADGGAAIQRKHGGLREIALINGAQNDACCGFGPSRFYQLVLEAPRDVGCVVAIVGYYGLLHLGIVKELVVQTFVIGVAGGWQWLRTLFEPFAE